MTPGSVPGGVLPTGEGSSGASPGGRGLPAPSESPQTVLDVRVVGHKDIPLSKIAALIKTRPGREYSEHVVQQDVRAMLTSRMFADVQRETVKLDNGVVVVFRVVERPLLKYVRFLGVRKMRLARVETESGLKVGQPVDPYSVEEARTKLEAFYAKKGYSHVHVEILEGNKPGDQGAVLVINEGQKLRISQVVFVGNTIATGERLKTQVQSRRPILWLFGGLVDREKIDGDVERLTNYYRSLGFFRARVSRELEYDADSNWLKLTFVIDEGPRYRVRNISFIGNVAFRTEDLAAQIKTEPNAYFDQLNLNKDLAAIQEVYGANGYVFADIQAEPRWLAHPDPMDMVDLVFVIKEGKQYRVGEIEVKIQGYQPDEAGYLPSETHTQITTVLNRVAVVGLRPGDIIDTRKIREAERRLRASGLFRNEPQRGISPKIVIQPADKEEELAEKKTGKTRGQSPDGALQRAGGRATLSIVASAESATPTWATMPQRRDAALWTPPKESVHPWARYVVPASARSVTPSDNRIPAPHAAQRPWQPAEGSQAGDHPVQLPKPAAPATRGPHSPPRTPLVRGQDLGTANPNPPSRPIFGAGPGTVTGGPVLGGNATPFAEDDGQGQSGGTLPPLPSPDDPHAGSVLPEGGYLRQFLEPSANIQVIAPEGQTGRFSMGVGINSDAGIVGQIVLDEQNFDILRPPSSFGEIIDGTAWRGAGQRFRIEAVPGSRVQRYTVSFFEPYLFDSNVSFGISGHYFDRLYLDWDEQRAGGTTTFGYQLRPDLSLSAQFRLESIEITNPRIPTAPEIAETLGQNDLYSVRLALTHDTRDSAYLPTEGHLFEIAGEQAFGAFTYPRASLDVRQYFMVYERPDRSGRHVISLRGRLGVAGTNTPVYDHYFAGGYSTLRGFDFRGIGPVSVNSKVGGEFLLLASAEYMFPISADDMIRGVVFVDTGTVERRVELHQDTFRVAPGVGLRINVPAMGDAPIALDFAWAIEKAPTDETQVFSFYLGLLR